MQIAGGGDALPERVRSFEDQPDVVAVAAAYVDLAKGDLRQALLEAVADGIATSHLVSRGYARWRQPERVRESGGRPKASAG